MLGAAFDLYLKTTGDFIRWFAICEVCLSLGFLMGIMAKGSQIWHGRDNTQYRFPLPFLYGFGLSYILYGFGVISEITLRLGEAITFRTILALVAGTVGVVTMAYLYWYDHDD